MFFGGLPREITADDAVVALGEFLRAAEARSGFSKARFRVLALPEELENAIYQRGEEVPFAEIRIATEEERKQDPLIPFRIFTLDVPTVASRILSRFPDAEDLEGLSPEEQKVLQSSLAIALL